MINESQPVKTEEENEFKLKENQERFFFGKKRPHPNMPGTRRFREFSQDVYILAEPA
jgi:hypothetical protein